MPDHRTVLCGDIGGTNSRLALATVSATGVVLSHRQQFGNADESSLGDVLQRYLSATPFPDRACIAVAGPTDGRSVSLTNLSWQIDANALGNRFGFPFALVNDFEAVAWGLDALSADDCRVLQAAPGEPGRPRLALGPGTGLGVALSTWAGSAYSPMPGEGGHIGFAPTDDRQTELLAFLQGRYGRVSVERILSGQGIVDLYAFCSGGTPLTAAAITTAALDGSNPAATEAMRLFCRVLGQTAGDLALVGGTLGGVYIAGGIPPRILPLLEQGELLAGFLDKGRFEAWIRQIPLLVVTDPDIGLKGAALAS